MDIQEVKEFEALPDREELEKLALMAVCACNYYDLADNIEITTDEELWQIIDNRDTECENCKGE